MQDLAAVAAVEAMCSLRKRPRKKTLPVESNTTGNHFWLMFDGDRLIAFVDGFVTDEADLTDEMYANAAMHNENGAWQMIRREHTAPVPQARVRREAGSVRPSTRPRSRDARALC